jgi:DNA invertase Pin-like site-specific DNA recombinase
LTTTARKVRCAIYTRKSTEEGLDMEFNSLDAQREACASYIASQRHEGWIAIDGFYDDGGFSGGTMERPALSRLIEDIKLGLVDTIVVYKVDRLSRSLTDFAKLVDVFDQHKVSFVSITQQFNTTTSMGRLTLNILLSFAQFEREVIGERIRDKFAASKRKGMWMGGVTPLGYEVRDRNLHIRDEDARSIRIIFESFLSLKSVSQVTTEIRQLGIVSRRRMTRTGRAYGGAPLDRGSVYKILNNPIYIGKIRHHGQLYDGRHPAIISQEVWDRAHELLQDSPRLRAPNEKRKSPAVLCGVLKCGGCMSSMTPVHTKKPDGKLYRYYSAIRHLKGGCGHCEVKRVPAREIEALVLLELQTIFMAPEMILDVWRAAVRQDDSVTTADVHDALTDLFPVWNELFPKEQERLIGLMLDSVVVYPDAVDLRLRASGLSGLVRALNQHKQRLETASGPAPHIAAE